MFLNKDIQDYHVNRQLHTHSLIYSFIYVCQWSLWLGIIFSRLDFLTSLQAAYGLRPMIVRSTSWLSGQLLQGLPQALEHWGANSFRSNNESLSQLEYISKEHLTPVSDELGFKRLFDNLRRFLLQTKSDCLTHYFWLRHLASKVYRLFPGLVVTVCILAPYINMEKTRTILQLKLCILKNLLSWWDSAKVGKGYGLFANVAQDICLTSAVWYYPTARVEELFHNLHLVIINRDGTWGGWKSLKLWSLVFLCLIINPRWCVSSSIISRDRFMLG